MNIQKRWESQVTNTIMCFTNTLRYELINNSKKYFQLQIEN